MASSSPTTSYMAAPEVTPETIAALTSTSRPQEDDVDEESGPLHEHWKASEYAVGLTRSHWADEISYGQDDLPPPYGHIWLTGICCGIILQRRRIGNFVLLCGTHVMVGPYWPILCGVTLPLLMSIALAALFRGDILDKPLFLGVWIAINGTCWTSLLLTGCRNPGIFKRHRTIPADAPDADTWRWNDQARTFRPEHARYDTDTKCVIDHFDHTCPWTGTAIGGGNIRSFYVFVSSVFISLICNCGILLY